MKIIFLTTEIPYPANSGGRIYTWERIKLLKEQGNEIYLISFVENELEVDKDVLNRYCNDITIIKRVINVKQLLRSILLPFSVTSKDEENVIKKIKELRKRNNVDCIICDTPQLFYTIRKNEDIPVIVTQHNIEFKVYGRIAKVSKGILKKIVYYHESMKLFFYEHYLKKFNIIKGYTFISEEDKNYFYNKVSKKSNILIPMGINEFNDKENINRKNNNIIFTGKMNYKPNIDAMIWFCSCIFPEIKLKNKDVKLYIVGKDPVEEIKKLESEDIIVTGMVDSVKEYFQKSSLAVIPLLSGGGVKIKLIEAIQNKIPIVTTKIGIEGTSFKDNEHVNVCDKDSEFAEKCVKVLNERESYNEMVNRAYELLKSQYLWSNIGKEYEVFIKNTIKK